VVVVVVVFKKRRGTRIKASSKSNHPLKRVGVAPAIATEIVKAHLANQGLAQAGFANARETFDQEVSLVPISLAYHAKYLERSSPVHESTITCGLN
jgi:hypothetical protein